MSNFIAIDRNTLYLLPPSVNDWLTEDHLARFVGESSINWTYPILRGRFASGRGYNPN